MVWNSKHDFHQKLPGSNPAKCTPPKKKAEMMKLILLRFIGAEYFRNHDRA